MRWNLAFTSLLSFRICASVLSLSFLVLPLVAIAGTWEIGFSFAAPSSQTNGLTFDGRYLWHTNDISPIIYEIDPLDGHVVGQQTTKLPDQGDLEFGNGVLYIVGENHHIIYKVDQTSGLTLDTIQVHGIPLGSSSRFRRDSIQMEGLTFDGENIWVDGDTNVIIRVELATKKCYRYQMSYDMGYLDGMTWAFDHLWIVTNNATIYELDPCTMGIIDRFDAPASVGAGPEGFAFDGENLWFADNDLDKIYKIILKDKLLTKRAATSKTARTSGCDKGVLMTAADDALVQATTALQSPRRLRHPAVTIRDAAIFNLAAQVTGRRP
jgi:hypothetical protein